MYVQVRFSTKKCAFWIGNGSKMSQKCSKIPIWVKNSRNLASFPQKSAQISTKKHNAQYQPQNWLIEVIFDLNLTKNRHFWAWNSLKNDCYDCYEKYNTRCDNNNGGQAQSEYLATFWTLKNVEILWDIFEKLSLNTVKWPKLGQFTILEIIRFE